MNRIFKRYHQLWSLDFKHHTNLHPDLVNEDNAGLALRNNTGEL